MDYDQAYRLVSGYYDEQQDRMLNDMEETQEIEETQSVDATRQ